MHVKRKNLAVPQKSFWVELHELVMFFANALIRYNHQQLEGFVLLCEVIVPGSTQILRCRTIEKKIMKYILKLIKLHNLRKTDII